MNLRLAIAAGILAFGTSGCATVFEGTSQEITVTTNPPGASCVFNRVDGKVVGQIASTPETLNTRKSKYDILVKCNKQGYQEATYLNHSGTTATIAANVAADLILTAGLSSIESATFAQRYHETPSARMDIPLSQIRPTLPQTLTAQEFLSDELVRRLDIPFISSPLTIKQKGLIKVRAFVGDEIFKLGSLRVDQNIPASPQPPGQEVRTADLGS